MNFNTIFRGKRLDNGKIFEGHGVFFDQFEGKEYPRHAYIIADEFPLCSKLWHRVDPNSIEVIDEEIEEIEQ